MQFEKNTEDSMLCSIGNYWRQSEVKLQIALRTFTAFFIMKKCGIVVSFWQSNAFLAIHLLTNYLW